MRILNETKKVISRVDGNNYIYVYLYSVVPTCNAVIYINNKLLANV